MKTCDDYNAKYQIWAENPRVRPLPRFEGVPEFGVRRFSSYEELNRWKRELLEQIARSGGLRWTR
jgi:hypothetical protein